MFKRFLPTATAMVFGMLVLAGYLLPVDVFVRLRVLLLRWATVLGVFALLLAYLSVLRVHLTRISRGEHSVTSVLIVLSAIGSLVLVLWNGADGQWTQQLVDAVLVPGESALLALTAVTLIVAGMRIFRVRRSVGSLVFVLVTIFFLLTAIPYIYPELVERVVGVVDAMAMAGMRGVVLGVALGVVLTGLRTIFGIDRPHSDE